MNYILKSSQPISEFQKQGGGKAFNLARLTQGSFPVPPWFCISCQAFQDFILENHLGKHLTPKDNLEKFSTEVEELILSSPLSKKLVQQIQEALFETRLAQTYVAVRSSGLDEDSGQNSFAGQFSSFLYQKDLEQILHSLKSCWVSGYSYRALSYRFNRNLPLNSIQMGVVIQKMVNATSAGVSFSRNPIRPLNRSSLLISSVWGLGEGLVSGDLDADHFEVDRENLVVTPTLIKKTHAFHQNVNSCGTPGITKLALPEAKQDAPSLSNDQVKKVTELTLRLEDHLKEPQDCEWAFEEDDLFLLQARPITSIPKDVFFDASVNGNQPILWDNSNIIESYNGITSPLTFSFASSAYRQVYIQFCELLGVPKNVIASHETMFTNMLGLVRGRIYYNLIHWYQLVLMLPGTSNNKGFMETMMGVKQSIKPEMSGIFEQIQTPEYSRFKRLTLGMMTFYRFLRIDSIIRDFQDHFNHVYERTRKMNFAEISLPELAKHYRNLDEQILKQWKAPIINDYLCMIFFGLLKKLTANWVMEGDSGASLQNDLLCGEGAMESTEPTKMLMKIAEKIDKGDPQIRTWFLTTSPEEILKNPKSVEVDQWIHEFLDRYGFRCINELKLEEPDLHDDPHFAIHAISNYVRMKNYSISALESRETEIRKSAENEVQKRLKGIKGKLYFWVLNQARKAVRNRENLRFARTKIFGIARHLFRGIGHQLVQLGIISTQSDIFYLTLDEILAFIEGRSVTMNLSALIAIRKSEYEKFRKSPSPPDRLITQGAAGVSNLYPQILLEGNLIKDEHLDSLDPFLLKGTPCCPGSLEGTVRVVENLKDAIGINGEILVTARTDPGWVPLYPSCSGLLIERGSLLSHSAVVARELGLPTIVGISGGLMKKLKTGHTVQMDAGKGEVRIQA